MSYPKGTLLRYYPSADTQHYTCVVLTNGVLQVKPSKAQFSTLSDWLTTLPGQPIENKLETVAKPPVLEWKSSKPSFHYLTQQPWIAYLLQVIKRTNRNLTKNAELCDAYNHLVDVLDAFHDKFIILLPYRSRRCAKYESVKWSQPHSGLPNEKWTLLPTRLAIYHVEKYQIWLDTYEYKKEFAPKVYEAYQLLYALMEKHGVIRYVEEHNNRVDNHYLRRSIEREERILYKIQCKLRRLQEDEKYQQSRINVLKEKLACSK